jgi:hypothetical protein
MAQLNISLPPPKDSPDFDGWLVQVAQYLRDYLGNDLVSLGDGTEASPALTFSSDSDCGIYRVGANEFAIVVGGEAVLRFKRTATETIMGHPENFNGEAPYFQVSEVYSTPAVQAQSIFITGEADSSDLALRRINGSSSAPTTVLDNEWCGQIYWWPYDGTGYDPGPIYGAAADAGWYDDEPGNNSVGPYNFSVELGASPTDIVVFVEDAASKTMSPANMKTLTTHYTFTYNDGTNALAVTFTGGNEPAVGKTIWVFRRYNWMGTAPFYGRQGSIKVISSETPTQTARGGVMTFEVCKNGQIVSRPRMWLDGTTGNLVLAGKAVHEGDTTGQGKYYPDRVNTSGSYKNGCPSGVVPVDYGGKGTLTIAGVDSSVDSCIAIRRWNSQTDGVDFSYDVATDNLLIQTVMSDSKTTRWIRPAISYLALTRALTSARVRLQSMTFMLTTSRT